MKSFPILLPVLLAITACQPSGPEMPIPIADTRSATWQLSYVDWWAPTIAALYVGENELRILNNMGITRLDARGKRVETVLRSIHDIDLFSRPVFSHQFLMHKHSQLSNFFVLEVAEWGLNYPGYDMNEYSNTYSVLHPPEDDSSYSAFLNGAECGAVNNWGEFLVPAVKKSEPDRVTLLAVDPYEWFGQGYGFSSARRWEVSLPPEAGMRLRRLRGLGEDYLVSTDQATFLLRREGGLTRLWDSGITHAFEADGAWYAELEAVLYRSTDEGQSWLRQGPGASRLGAGEYYVFDSTLVYARLDSLYRVRLPSGALQPLDNQGLEANYITSVASFADSIYVGTLTGLYTKPRYAL